MQKKSRVDILVLDKLDFKPKTIRRGGVGKYTIIKGSNYEEYLTAAVSLTPFFYL